MQVNYNPALINKKTIDSLLSKVHNSTYTPSHNPCSQQLIHLTQLFVTYNHKTFKDVLRCVAAKRYVQLMRTLKNILLGLTFTIGSTCAAQQFEDSSLLIGRWYFCESPIKPIEVKKEKLLLREAPQCEDLYEFYWEFINDGSFKHSDTIQNPKVGNMQIIDGVVVLFPSERGWKIESNILIIGEARYYIDKLDENCLKLRRTFIEE